MYSLVPAHLSVLGAEYRPQIVCVSSRQPAPAYIYVHLRQHIYDVLAAAAYVWTEACLTNAAAIIGLSSSSTASSEACLVH